jgi:hypothetical protein
MQTVKTRAVCRVPLVGCLTKASEYKSLPNNWEPINDEQIEFVRHVQLSQELSSFSSEEFDSVASDSAEVINNWLADNGFSLRCPEIKPDGFGVASFVKMLVNWLNEGEKSRVASNDVDYPAVYFKGNTGAKIRLHDSEWGVTCLPTKESNTKVFCAMILGEENTDYNYNAISEEKLLDIAESLENNYHNGEFIFKNVYLPMIDMNIEVNQEWMAGMRNDVWLVESCVQQFILKLNEKGAIAKSAAVMSIGAAAMVMQEIPLVFDKPFLLWFSRDGVTFPAFLVVCGQDCWKEPKDLS